jgi:hypothetical protein
MRNSIFRPSGSAAMRARITRWISTASVAVGNSARKLSPMKSTQPAAVVVDQVRNLGPVRAEPADSLVLVLDHQTRVPDDVG